MAKAPRKGSPDLRKERSAPLLRAPAESFPNIVCALVVALCLFLYIRTSILSPIPTLRTQTDFSAYFHAAQHVLDGVSPYNDPVFFYPPLLAFFMIPFALIDYVSARWVWFILSHLLLIGSGGLLWRFMSGGRVALCCIAGIWALGGAFPETLKQGQLSPLLVFLLVVSYTRRGCMQGTSAGLCFAFKYFPGIVALPLLLGRNRRALVAAAAVGVAGVCVPWLILSAFFTGARAPVSAHYWMGTPHMWSWSMPSVVLRIFIPVARGAPFPTDWEFGNVAATLHIGSRLELISVGTAGAVFAAGMIALGLVCHGRLNGRQIPWAMVGLVALSLAVAPVSWTHYQLLQYPGVAMLMVAGIRLRDWRLAFATAVSFGLGYQLPERFLIAYHDAHNGWSTASPVTLYFWTSMPVFATLGIFAFSLVMVRRAETGEAVHGNSS